MYDRATVQTLNGRVVEYGWSNPHVYVYVEVVDAAERPVVWEIEANGVAAMSRYGWSEDSLAPGDRITVQLNPHKNADRHVGLGVTISMRDGRVVPVNGPAETENDSAVFAANGLWGTWLPSGDSIPYFLSLRENTEDWPLTPKGIEFVQSFSVATDDAAANCEPYAAPFSMLWPSATQLSAEDDTIVIGFPAVTGDEKRIVHMNVDSHDGVAYTILGHSIGRWEGETLVVNTELFSYHPEGNASQLASGPQKRVTERFELAPDRTTLTYRFVLEDPEYLTEPIEGQDVWAYRPDVEYLTLPCDIENARHYLE